MEGKLEGRCRPRRKMNLWLKNLRNRFGLNSKSDFLAAAYKARIAVMFPNFRLGGGFLKDKTRFEFQLKKIVVDTTSADPYFQ